jgi:putative DNA primase/helicase
MTKKDAKRGRRLCVEKFTEYYPGGKTDAKHNYRFTSSTGAVIEINLVSEIWKNVHNPGFSGQGASKLIAAIQGKKEREILESIISPEGAKHKTLDKGKLYDNRFFEVLGYGKSTFFFLSKEHGDILKVAYTGMNNHVFQYLAPLHFWRKLGLGVHVKGGDFRFFTNNIIGSFRAIITEKGIFNFKRVRCRGAWKEDKGQIIINTGMDIIENGEKIPIEKYKTKYVYEKGDEINFNMKEPLEDELGCKVFDVINKVSFKDSVMGYWLAGWCVLAPFGGALQWRPHVFLTGGSGTGKSTVMRMIVNKLLGDFSIKTFGKSTEAGIRRGISGDSIPVLIDEGEPKKERLGIDKTQNLIELARISSSEEQDYSIMMAEGSHVADYKVRSCWMFTAVVPAIIKRADVTRFSTIELIQAYNGKTWHKFEEEIEKTITPEISEKLKSRVIKNYDTLSENIKTFKKAVSDVFENSRIGDQVGTLLAGAMFLKSLKEYTIEEAKGIVIEADVKKSLDFLDYSYDEMKCFDFIMQFMLRDLDNLPIISAINKYEAAIISHNREGALRIKRALNPYGIDLRELDGKRYLFIMIGNTHIEEILKNTDFRNYDRILNRLDFCVGKKGNVRFGNMGKKTALYFDPAAVLNDEYSEDD